MLFILAQSRRVTFRVIRQLGVNIVYSAPLREIIKSFRIAQSRRVYLHDKKLCVLRGLSGEQPTRAKKRVIAIKCRLMTARHGDNFARHGDNFVKRLLAELSHGVMLIKWPLMLIKCPLITVKCHLFYRLQTKCKCYGLVRSYIFS